MEQGRCTLGGSRNADLMVKRPNWPWAGDTGVLGPKGMQQRVLRELADVILQPPSMISECLL